MKKNIAMRVAAILFILTMISTCAFSTTFAKYVTSDEATDTARVAKWGVKVNVSSDSMYDSTYKADDTSFTLTENTVVSSDGDLLVAPGTKGSLTHLTLTGTPEVAVKITYVSTFNLNNWITVDQDDDTGTAEVLYCPIIFTVKYGDGAETKFNGLDYNSADALKVAIENHINSQTTSYAANADLKDADEFVISWAWAFTGNTGSVVSQTDAFDTALGDAAVNTNAPEIDFTLEVTVTQID